MIEQLVEVHATIEQTIVDLEWNEFVHKQTKASTRAKANSVRRKVCPRFLLEDMFELRTYGGAYIGDPLRQAPMHGQSVARDEECGEAR